MMKRGDRSKFRATLKHSYLSRDDLLDVGIHTVGNNVQISETCKIIGVENIRIGDNVIIDAGVVINCKTGSITIGNHVHVASGCYLNGTGTIVLSDFCGLASGARIYSATDDYMGETLTNPTVPEEFVGVKYLPVHFGRHVIIGSGTVVLPGGSIGEGSSVGSLSLVTKALDSWGVFYGIPARRVKDRSRKLLELERMLVQTG